MRAIIPYVFSPQKYPKYKIAFLLTPIKSESSQSVLLYCAVFQIRWSPNRSVLLQKERFLKISRSGLLSVIGKESPLPVDFREIILGDASFCKKTTRPPLCLASILTMVTQDASHLLHYRRPTTTYSTI